jgi:hypothetical protein
MRDTDEARDVAQCAPRLQGEERTRNGILSTLRTARRTWPSGPSGVSSVIEAIPAALGVLATAPAV